MMKMRNGNMKTGLIDVDGHNFPNLPLMKISAYHKAHGDEVEWWNGLKHYDRVYMSKVFNGSPDVETVIQADEVIRGGTGYNLDSRLPPGIENVHPDYGLYGIRDTAYGFLTRGCPRDCGFCIVTEKEGRRSEKVADLTDFWNGQKTITLLDPNLLAYGERYGPLGQLADSDAYVDFTQGLDIRLVDDGVINLLNGIRTKMLHFAWDDPDDVETAEKLGLFAEKSRIQDFRKRRVYVLTNFNSTHEQDLYRVYRLREMKYDPYVMIYAKESAPRRTRHLQRWVNNKRVFRVCERFGDYDPKMG